MRELVAAAHNIGSVIELIQDIAEQRLESATVDLVREVSAALRFGLRVADLSL
jgi:hypothetical protein